MSAVACPKCGVTIAVPIGVAGEMNCPKCRASFFVAAPAAPPPAPPRPSSFDEVIEQELAEPPQSTVPPRVQPKADDWGTPVWSRHASKQTSSGIPRPLKLLAICVVVAIAGAILIGLQDRPRKTEERPELTEAEVAKAQELVASLEDFKRSGLIVRYQLPEVWVDGAFVLTDIQGKTVIGATAYQAHKAATRHESQITFRSNLTGKVIATYDPARGVDVK